MTRRSLSRLQRVRIFDDHKGICHLCKTPINAGRGEKWDVEHVVPLCLGGADEPENMRPAHVDCHAVKSRKERGVKAKNDRVRANHLGIRKPRPSFLTNRNGPFKKRMDGTVVRRHRRAHATGM